MLTIILVIYAIGCGIVATLCVLFTLMASSLTRSGFAWDDILISVGITVGLTLLWPVVLSIWVLGGLWNYIREVYSN